MEILAETPAKQLQFQLRGREINRIEAVSDVVFGFALSMLVVSLEVPRTYTDLIAAVRGFPAFALTFAALMWVWVRHYYFFRYYGLDDLTTIFLNTGTRFVMRIRLRLCFDRTSTTIRAVCGDNGSIRIRSPLPYRNRAVSPRPRRRLQATPTHSR
ncbi:MAG: TMEM175 family protein [Candidatus Binatus sp.]